MDVYGYARSLTRKLSGVNSNAMNNMCSLLADKLRSLSAQLTIKPSSTQLFAERKEKR
jgi:hypothetical protein